MLKLFHFGETACVGSVNSYVPANLIITLQCFSLDSPYIANQGNIGKKHPIFLQAPLFWEELRPLIRL